MRCNEVTLELSAPTGSLDPRALATHLASCPACATWANQVERFDRLWEATSPPEPASFDALWDRVMQAADAQRDHVTLSLADARQRRLRWIAVAVVAQAAALLIATVFVLNRGGIGSGPVPVHLATQPTHGPVATSALDVEDGQILFIHLNDDGVKVVRRPQVETSDTVTVAVDFDLFNGMESLE